MASSPASEPTAAAIPQPTVSITPTRTPRVRATSGANAAARIRRPSGVYLNTTSTSAAIASTTSTTKRSLAENRPTKSKAYGYASGSLDQIIPATACSTRSSPRVTMIELSSERWRSGRISSRSVTTPSSVPATIATAKPSQ